MTQDSESVAQTRQLAGFPRLLREWMGDRTRAAAADALDVTWGTIDHWLKGEHQPPASRVRGLSRLMGLPAEQIRAALAGQPWPPVAATPTVPAAGSTLVENAQPVGACHQPAASEAP